MLLVHTAYQLRIIPPKPQVARKAPQVPTHQHVKVPLRKSFNRAMSQRRANNRFPTNAHAIANHRKMQQQASAHRLPYYRNASPFMHGNVNKVSSVPGQYAYRRKLAQKRIMQRRPAARYLKKTETKVEQPSKQADGATTNNAVTATPANGATKDRKLQKSKRKLFVTPWFVARRKRWDQYMRFSDMKKQMLNEVIGNYQSSETLNNLNNDALEQVHKIYQNDVEQIEKTKTALMEQLDNIYNNLINPSRWFY